MTIFYTSISIGVVDFVTFCREPNAAKSLDLP